jgi:(1->4)-alpha-D-glucan 1-alpha-D-glucosylmutase
MKRPSSTYRLQLHAGFDFGKASAILDYLRRLGVTDVYTSPYLQAEAGSMHGYNVVSHTAINEELGGEEGYLAFTDAVRDRGLGHILDMVPNHMGIGCADNAWWMDVLENGPASMYADFFDILWDPPKVGLRNKVLLPILGDQYGAVLERGELKLEREGGTFGVRYWERRLPVSPDSVLPILERVAERVELPDGDMELESIMTALRHLPPPDSTSDEARAERHREKEVFKRRLEALCAEANEVCRMLDAVITEFNGRPGEASSFDDLDRLLRQQSYRLAFWRVATEEINYRRFFDINELAALRMENPAVFEASHELVLRFIEEGRITGLRLDHTDGLYDPLAYFRELQARRSAQTLAPVRQEAQGFQLAMAGGGGGGAIAPSDRPLYVLAEKILEPGEHLPRRWPIHGTTGYDFIALAGGLFVDPSAERAFTSLYERFTGEELRYQELLYNSKRLIMRSSLSSEVHVLAQLLERLAEGNRRSRDFTLPSLTHAIVETIAAFPVYRTYVREDGTREEHDDRYVQTAIRAAKRRNPSTNASIFDYLEDVLKLNFPENATPEQREEQSRFVLKFQQVTSPVMAKGAEDTAFYNYNRLTCLNEVGCDPAHFGTRVSEFHEGNRERLKAWPLSMLASSTHDTKRGEDTRARIAVLSEAPTAWKEALAVFSRLARAKKIEVDGDLAPSRNDEYLFYQTVLGAWPLDGNMAGFTDRLQAYMAKATKEAKRHTSWVNPNPGYDEAITRFVSAMMADGRFVARMGQLAAAIAPYGATNGLAGTLLKLTAPGVPDTYQGSELWNQSLVDPDNRRPVDYEARGRMLDRIESGLGDRARLATELLSQYEDGAVKLYVTHVTLKRRLEAPNLFLDGAYQPLEGGEHCVAFARAHAGQVVVSAAPRFACKLTGGSGEWPLGAAWGDRRLALPAPGRYRNLFTDEVVEGHADVPLAEVFSRFPVALLERIGD